MSFITVTPHQPEIEIDADVDSLVEGQAIPAADSTDNVLSRDVVGNKTDATVGAVTTTKSLMGYTKGILEDTGTTIPALHAVPTADATTNTNVRDVVGNKTDAAVGAVTTDKSLMGYTKGILEDTGTTIPATITALQSDVGDPSARTNLQSLTAMLGNPDTADKTVWNEIKFVHTTAVDGSAAPVANTLSDILHKDGSYTYDNTTDSLEAISDLVTVADTAIDNVQTDLGDPSARTNFKSIETMVGIPDAANSCVDDIIRTGFDSSAITASLTGSILEVLKYIATLQLPRVATKTYADLTGYDTAAAFTVSGDVLVRCFGTVGATGITSTSGTTTLSVGTTADTDACLPATTIDNSDFAAGDAWADNNPEDDAVALSTTGWVLIAGGADIVLTRSVDDITAGTLSLYCEYIPISSGATVVAA